MPRSAPLLLLLFVVGCGGAQVSPESLADTALNESLPVPEREKAIVELVRRGPREVPLLRKVATQSKTPSVRVIAIQPLGIARDLDSAPMLFAACEDSDSLVRGQAGTALAKILSENFHFRPDDPLEVRKAKLRAMHKSYEGLLLKPEIKKRREETK